MSFPHATEKISWGHDLTFRVNEKIFAVTVLEPAPVWLSFKCTPETLAELTERMGIIPAPYMARAKWVALETKEALSADELTRLLRESYDLVFAKLPKRTQESLAQGAGSAKRNRVRTGTARPSTKKSRPPSASVAARKPSAATISDVSPSELRRVAISGTQ